MPTVPRVLTPNDTVLTSRLPPKRTTERDAFAPRPTYNY